MPTAPKPRSITEGRLPVEARPSLGAEPDTASPELYYAYPPVIASLKRRLGAARVRLAANEIDEQECQRQLADAIEDFWSAAAKGTPVIDPAPADDSRALVTFLWRGGKAKVVLLLGLLPDAATPNNPLRAAHAGPFFSAPLFAGFMRHITETDIWYAAWLVPLGWRASYCFLPSSSKRSIPGAGSIPSVRSARGAKGAKGADSMDEKAIRWILARAQPDPHNPRQPQDHPPPEQRRADALADRPR
ncbi:MAG: DUF3327 domain-containing protein [Coriobacteriales bacterium]|nr:DUF3327 domain-containing protein [Coriobacteriales bacterium]